jgi:hypothetical protein
VDQPSTPAQVTTQLSSTKPSTKEAIVTTARDRQAQRDRLDQQVNKDLTALLVRQEHLENLVRQDRQAQRDLLVRLESVLANSKEFWYQKTTVLKWMIIILVLIVLDRLLSHFPQIIQFVEKLS